MIVFVARKKGLVLGDQDRDQDSFTFLGTESGIICWDKADFNKYKITRPKALSKEPQHVLFWKPADVRLDVDAYGYQWTG